MHLRAIHSVAVEAVGQHADFACVAATAVYWSIVQWSTTGCKGCTNNIHPHSPHMSAVRNYTPAQWFDAVF